MHHQPFVAIRFATFPRILAQDMARFNLHGRTQRSFATC
jgi:hypothetical protein